MSLALLSVPGVKSVLLDGHLVGDEMGGVTSLRQKLSFRGLIYLLVLQFAETYVTGIEATRHTRLVKVLKLRVILL